MITETDQEAIASSDLFALLDEWLDAAKIEDDLAERSKDTTNGSLACARGRTLRNCAKELAERIFANAHDPRRESGES